MESLGINPVLLVAQIISFLVLWLVMSRFLYRPIRKSLEDRRNMVKKIFSDNEELEKKLAKLEHEQAIKKRELLEYKKKVETEAKKNANLTRKEIISKAEAEGEREIVKAREQIAVEAESAKHKLAAESAAAAVQIAEQIIGKKVADKDWQKKEINKSLEALGNNQ